MTTLHAWPEKKAEKKSILDEVNEHRIKLEVQMSQAPSAKRRHRSFSGLKLIFLPRANLS